MQVAAPGSRNRLPSASDGTEASRARFLDGTTSLEEALRVVRSGTEGDTVSVRAYSFDQPDLVRDLSQAKGKTKMQLQVLQELTTAGCDVRLTTGKSVRDAYINDHRDVRVGSGLQRLHHAKSILVLRATSAAELVVGSTNWTTSSRANRECGALLKFTSSRAKFMRDWVADFEAAYDSGISVQAAVEGRDAALASGSRNRMPRVTRATSL